MSHSRHQIYIDDGLQHFTDRSWHSILIASYRHFISIIFISMIQKSSRIAPYSSVILTDIICDDIDIKLIWLALIPHSQYLPSSIHSVLLQVHTGLINKCRLSIKECHNAVFIKTGSYASYHRSC